MCIRVDNVRVNAWTDQVGTSRLITVRAILTDVTPPIIQNRRGVVEVNFPSFPVWLHILPKQTRISGLQGRISV